ncbi:MAG: SRPBCC family protein [Sandaracinus sp.]
METTTERSTDRIEKTLDLKAPRARVWKAITDSAEFGSWFELALDGPFVPGGTLHGTITTKGKYEGFRFTLLVEKIEPESLFSYRWHPYAVDRERDYAKEPMTLVEFGLAEIPGGTRLTIVESGFDRIPRERREVAFRMNDQGWSIQIERVAKFVLDRDRIVRAIDVKASRARVWRAIADSRELAGWFGLAIDGPFVVGQTTVGIATERGGHRVEMTIETLDEARGVVSWTWHPFTKDQERDYSREAPTRVELRIDETPRGVRITITESGFAGLPDDRRAAAFDAHEGGWTHFATTLGRHVGG